MAVNVPPGFYDRNKRYGITSTKHHTIGTTPTRILDQVDGRLGVVVTNADTVTVYVGSYYDVLNGNGHALLAGNSLSLVTSAELFGVVASSTALVTTLEETVR